MQIDLNNTKKRKIKKKAQNFRPKNVEILPLHQENIICEEVFVVKNEKTKKCDKTIINTADCFIFT